MAKSPPIDRDVGAEGEAHSPFAKSVLSSPLSPAPVPSSEPLSESLVSTRTTPGIEPLDSSSSSSSRSQPATRSHAPTSGADTYRFYEIVGEQGSGGLGRVYRARDIRLDRLVALKELIDPSRDAEVRFLREVLLSARLQHPSIINVYEVGRKPDGAPFYAMKLVEGKPLDEVIREIAGLDERLALLPHILAVFEAIAYAHERGIIHRDLKPSNVIIGAFGETVVIDWGLAKDLREPTDDEPNPGGAISAAPFGEVLDIGQRTAGGAQMGTPAYMAPEQILGKDVDTATDIFALGGLLYHLLACRPPYGGDDESHARVVERITEGMPIPLDERVPNAPADLVAIVKKAMARDRTDRYPTTKELAKDLARYQTGQLVSAFRYSPRALLARFVRRHRGPVLATIGFLITLAVVGAFSIHRIVVERDRAEARSLELTMTQARTTLERDPSEAIAWLKTYPTNGPAWSDVASIAAEAQKRGVARYRIELFPTSWVRDLALSSDGRYAAACDEMQNVVVVDVESGQVVRRFRHPGTARRVMVVGDTAVAGGEDGVLLVVNLKSGVESTLPGTGGPIRALAAIPGSSSMIVTATKDGGVRVVDLAKPSVEQLIGRHEGTADRVVVSKSGKLIASVGSDDKLRVWDLSSSSSSMPPAARLTYAMSPGPRRSRAVFMDEDRKIALLEPNGSISALAVAVSNPPALTPPALTPPALNPTPLTPPALTSTALTPTAVTPTALTPTALTPTALTPTARAPTPTPLIPPARTPTALTPTALTPTPIISLTGHKVANEGIDVSPDGRSIASAGLDRTVRIWNVSDGTYRVLHGHPTEVVALRFSPDGSKLATAGVDGEIRIWDSRTGQDVRQLRGHPQSVEQLRWSSRTVLVAADLGGFMRVWRLEDDPHAILTGHNGDIVPMRFSPDGTHLATGSNDKTLRLWDLATGESKVLADHKGSVRYLDFAGTMLVSASLDQSVRLWLAEPVVGTEWTSHVLHESKRPISDLVVTKDGKHVAVAEVGGQLTFIDVSSGQSASIDPAHAGTIQALAAGVGASTGLVASGGDDRIVRLWDAKLGALQATFEGHDSEVNKLAFSPDGKRLAAGTRGGAIRVWQVSGGAFVTLAGHDKRITAMDWSPDGMLLATGSHDGVIKEWDLASTTPTTPPPTTTTPPTATTTTTTTTPTTPTTPPTTTTKERARALHNQHVSTLRFSPDGRFLASGSQDCTVRIWQSATLDLRAMHAHDNVLTNVAFSPDGRTLASTGWDDVVRLWPIEESRMLPMDRSALRQHLETLTTQTIPTQTIPNGPR